MYNRRFFPVMGFVTVLTMLTFILSACAGGQSAGAGATLAPLLSGVISGSTSTTSPTAGGSTPGSGFTPVPIPTGTTSASVPAPAPVSAGACSNPFLPVVAGASWTYSLTGGPANITITKTIPTVSAGGFTDQNVFLITGSDSVTQTGQWQCSQGALTDLTPLTSNFESTQATTTFKTTDLVGPSLPASAKTGNSWSQTYNVAVTSPAGSVTIQADETVSENCTTVGIESVTVAAGTFDAIHVSCQTSTSTTIAQTDPIVITSQGDKWYASNVGLVKSSDTGNVQAGKLSTSVLELTAYTIP